MYPNGLTMSGLRVDDKQKTSSPIMFIVYYSGQIPSSQPIERQIHDTT
jgi:hypothetical protein